MDDLNTKEASVTGVPVLTGIDNFFAWREAIEPVLIGIRAYDIVLGLEPYPKLPPMPTSSDIRLSESWKDRDAKARAYLRRTVSAALKAMIRDLSSSTETWQLLQALHDLCTPEHRSAINRKFANLFLDDGGDMVQHLNSFMELVSEASAAGLPWGQNDRERCDRFFDTLPHSLRVVRNDWRQLPKEEQNFLSLVRIYNEENASQKHTADRSANAMAMAAMHQRPPSGSSSGSHPQQRSSSKRSSGRGRGNSKSSRGRFNNQQSSFRPSSGHDKSRNPPKSNLCYGCGAHDHVRPNCPKTKHLGPGKGPICWKCHKQGHVQGECPDNTAAAVQPYPDADKMLAAALFSPEHLAASSNSTIITFMVDSGASRHIIDCPEALRNLRTTDKPLTFKGVGSMLSADTSGEVIGRLASGQMITFRDVVLLPNAGINLLSEELLRERGWIKIIDDDDQACLQHKDNKSWTIPLAKHGRARWLQIQVDFTTTPSSALLAPAQQAKPSSLLDLHHRLGHIGFSTIKKLVRLGHLPSTPESLDEKISCDSCSASKATRKPFNDTPLKGSQPLELIHSDIAGPLTPAYGGYRYYATFIDDFTDWTYVALLHSKSEVFHRLVDWIKVAERAFGTKAQVIRTDGGGEYVNKYLSTWTASRGIIHHITPPHTPELNGKAERKNRTLKEMTAAMLHSSQLPVLWWGHAILFAAILLMKITLVNNDRTIWEWVYKRKPSLGKAQAFGAVCWVHIPSADRNKSDLTCPKAWKGRIVSWPSERSGWGILNEATRKIVYSRNVSFGTSADAQVVESSSTTLDDQDLVHVDIDDAISDSSIDDDDPNSSDSEADEPVRLPRGRKRLEPEVGNHSSNSDRRSRPTVRAQGIRSLPVRANRGQRTSSYWNNYVTFTQEFEGFICPVTVLDDDPTSYQEAMARPDSKLWAKAFDNELQSLLKNETLEEVVLPPNAKVVSTKWVCKTKRDADGNFIKHKARLVGRGFTQRYGIDYDETYAPVGRMTSMRIFLVMAAVHKLIVWQMDAETAFLNPKMDRVLYISFPEGWKQVSPDATGLLVRKGLYGFKQSARLWWLDAVAELKKLGFDHSDADWGIFIRIEANGFPTIVFVYVDDFLIAGQTQDAVDSVRNGLKAAYKMSDIGPVGSVLGIKVQQIKDGFALFQGHYISTVLERYDMANCRADPTPIATGTKLVPEGAPLSDFDARQYQGLIGCLMWIALSTRPDISYAVSALARFNGAPTEAHLKVAKRVLRYLQGSKNLALVLRPSKHSTDSELVGYSDADWAGNIEDRRSQSGYVFMLHGATISWGSLRQQCVSLSSVESEYVALTEATKDAIWLRTAIFAYSQALPAAVSIVLNGDNQGALALAQNPGWHRRTKHIDIRYHFVRGQVEDGSIKLSYVSTTEQVADIFTKPTPAPTLIKHRSALGLINLTTSSVNSDDHISAEREC